MAEPSARARTHAWSRLVLESAAIAAIYAALGIGTYELGPIVQRYSAFWPAGGFAVAVLVWRGISRWPGILVGSAIVSFFWIASAPPEPTNEPAAFALIVAAIRAGATALCAWLVTRLGPTPLHRVRGVLGFLGAVGLLYPALTTLGTLAAFHLSGYPAAALGIQVVLVSFFIATGAGTVLVAAPLLLLVDRKVARPDRSWVEAVACAASILAVAAWVFREPRDLMVAYPPLYGVFPPLIWAATRFHVRGAAYGTACVAAVALLAATAAAAPSNVEQAIVLRLQIYLELVLASMLTLGAAVEERHDAAAALARERESLARTVAERTCAVRAERDLSRLVMETSGMLAARLDREGRYLEVNSQLEESLGFDASELIDKPYTAVIVPEQAALVDRTFRRIRAGLTNESYDVDVLARDGSRRQIHWSGTGLRGPDGTVEEVLATGVDVTDRNRALRELEGSMALLRATLEATADGILVVSADGRLSTYNERFAALWRIPRPILESGDDQRALDFVRDQLSDPEGFFDRVRYLYDHPAAESEDVIELRDGRIFERFSKPQRIGERLAGRVWSFRDVTGRVRAEADRDRLLVDERRARQAAEQAYEAAREAVALRDEFLSIASHELKTPLTSFKARLQGLHRLIDRRRDGVVDARRLRSVLELANRQLARVQHLVEELVDVSRLGGREIALEPARMNLREVVLEAIARHAADAARARTPIELREGPAIAGSWDVARLRQLVEILVDNAIKFGAGRPAEVSLEADEARLVLRVTDHGIGLRSEDRGRIFERFGRAVDARHYGGLGLGLWLARRIAESGGGSLSVESRPGEGATFVAELPRWLDSSAAPAREERP